MMHHSFFLFSFFFSSPLLSQAYRHIFIFIMYTSSHSNRAVSVFLVTFSHPKTTWIMRPRCDPLAVARCKFSRRHGGILWNGEFASYSVQDASRRMNHPSVVETGSLSIVSSQLPAVAPSPRRPSSRPLVPSQGGEKLSFESRC